MTSLGLIDEMESDVSSPTIGDNSLKEMSELCAEQVQLEGELAELEEQLKAKAKAIRKLSEEIIDYISFEVDTNIRELEGIIISLIAHSTIEKSDIKPI